MAPRSVSPPFAAAVARTRALWAGVLLAFAAPSVARATPATDVGAPRFASAFDLDAVAYARAAARARALNAAPRALDAPGVSVAMTTNPKLTLDSNQPCSAGPQAAYVAFRVTNTSGGALTNLFVTLSGFANGIALAGGQLAKQRVGNLAAGASQVVFWFITYPCTVGNAATLTASVSDATAGVTTGSGAVTTSSMISANAGGILMSATLGSSGIIGAPFYIEVTYEFGGASAGDTYDLQPAGNSTFNGGCFQLTRTEITSSNVTAVPANASSNDRLFFTASVSQTGTGKSLTIRFWFRASCVGQGTTIKPYSNQLSGTQLKYAGNYSTFVSPSFPPAVAPGSGSQVVTKAVSSTKLAAGGTVTYTVTLLNPSTLAYAVDSIVDSLPAGVAFGAIAAGSGITSATSSIPAAGATGAIVFRASSYSGISIPAGGSVVLSYTATVTSTVGTYTNKVAPYLLSYQLGTASATVTVGSANLSFTKAGPDSARIGDTLTFVLTLANAGPNPATGVVLRDSLPATYTFLSATNSGAATGRLVSWPTIATLASGASRVDTVRVVVTDTGTAVNIAFATANQFDAVAGNNDGTGVGRRTTIVTVQFFAVTVTPQGLGTAARRIAGRASQPFVVTNGSGRAATFDLRALRDTGTVAFVTLDSVTGTRLAAAVADSARLSLPAAADTFFVWYTVAQGDTAQNIVRLRARSVADGSVTSTGYAEVRRTYPRLTLQRTVSTDTAASGEDITYTLAFRNSGEYAARNPSLVEVIPAQVAFKVGSAAASVPGGVTTAFEYSTSATGTDWTYTPSSGSCGAMTGYDACVRRVRLNLAGDLAADAVAPQGTLTYVARVP